MLLLDEPTNNLDLDARRRLYAAVESWPGVLLVVSHDRALLSRVDQVADLSGGSLRMYGGNLEAYEAMLATEQAAVQRAVTAAEADVRREKRDLIETQVKQARRDRMGRAARRVGLDTEDRRRRAQARRGGVGGQGPGGRPRAHRRREGPPRRGGGRRCATTRRSGSRCRARRCPPGGPW